MASIMQGAKIGIEGLRREEHADARASSGEDRGYRREDPEELTLTSRSRKMYGPALDVDSTRAFLFESADCRFLAVSLERGGDNLPPGSGGPWRPRTEFQLGVHEVMPVPVDPEPILRGLKARGYFVWPVFRTQPFGTAQ